MSIRPSTQQRKAIEAPLGPVLVVAGPGAGKTFCLINRIGYVVARLGIPAEQICAVTFTNKAAEEIAARLKDELGARATAVHRGTIHALCAEILRDHTQASGLKAGFGIADEDYQRTVLRQLGQGRRDSQLLKLFCKRRVQDYRLTPGDEQLFLDYQAILKRRNLVDFDDLLVRTVRLFEERADIARQVAGRWRYLLVDEFQDINPVQYDLLRRLAEPHRNVFAVGDDEQSIFSWTGADPGVLGRFQRDYGASPVLLDHNHRCSQQVFAAARQLLAANPTLFGDKDLRATRLSLHAVRAVGFDEDDQEATWIIGDIAADRDGQNAARPEEPLDWGDYAILYRRHEVGARIESHLLKAGIPCRMARGRPLVDDKVIGPVITAIRLVRDPFDAAAAESFARRVLPDHLMHRVESEVRSVNADFLLAVRDLAGSMPAADPDTKKLWRLVYQVENLAAMRGKHATLGALVTELLEQRLSVYKNALEDRHEDFSDPASLPEAVALAGRLRRAQLGRSRVVVEPLRGLELALRGMLFQAGFKRATLRHDVEQAELDDVGIAESDAGPRGLSFTLFKALQLVYAGDTVDRPRRYVTFDLETTGTDTAACGIVEIAGVRVEHGVPVAEFRELLNPGMPIEPEATRQHGYSDADVAAAPAFAEVWPRFRAFVGADPLVAHNGHDFDVPVLRRHAQQAGSNHPIQAYDTLPLARSLGGGSARLTSLAERFGIPVGRAHHALDDARMLAAVYEELERRRLIRARKASLVNVLPWLGLALAIEQPPGDAESQLLFEISRLRALGRYSDALEVYHTERTGRGLHGPSFDELIERLGGRRRMEALRAERDAASLFPEALARLAALMEHHQGESLDVAIERFLERVSLSVAHGADVGRSRVNLLTLHSTKGLEFSRVYIVGAEDAQLPGFIGQDEDPAQATQEARRLLYVGMTRARDRLVLTRVGKRNGRPSGGSTFLDEMGLVTERLELLPTP